MKTKTKLEATSKIMWGPSAWASYLINGDASGLRDDAEIVQADEWVAWCGGRVVDCEGGEFGVAYLNGGQRFVGDICMYTFHTEV